MLEHLQPGKPRVAMLGVYLALYDHAFPGYREQMTRYMEEIAASLRDAIEIPLLGASCQEREAEAFIKQAEAAGAEALLVLSLGYTNSLSVAGPLTRTGLPLIFFNTQKLDEVDSSFCFEDLANNHGMQGVQDINCVLVRNGRAFDIVTGLISQPEVKNELVDLAASIHARTLIRASRMGYIGPTMPGMGDTVVDLDELERVFGIRSRELQFKELGDAARQATPEEIESARAFDLDHFAPAEDLTPEDHVRSLRLEIGMRRLVREHRLAGLTLSFDSAATARELETIPFLGISKLLAEGVAYAGEGDRFATAGGIITHAVCGEVNFTEMYTMDFRTNTVLDTHMAEGNWRMGRRDRKPRLLRRQFTLADCLPFAALTFSLEPGPVTLISLTQTAEGRFHFITLEAEVADFPPLATMEIPNFKLKFERDIRPILNEYGLLGGTHHLSMAYGRRACRFRKLAELFDCQYSHIRTN